MEKVAKMEKIAVIETGGKQYRVSVGDLVKVEKIIGDYEVGNKMVFDKVLLVDDGKNTSIGDPYVKEAKVEAVLNKISKAKKVKVVQYKAKSRYLKQRGHRQPFMEFEITGIK